MAHGIQLNIANAQPDLADIPHAETVPFFCATAAIVLSLDIPTALIVFVDVRHKIARGIATTSSSVRSTNIEVFDKSDFAMFFSSSLK